MSTTSGIYLHIMGIWKAVREDIAHSPLREVRIPRCPLKESQIDKNLPLLAAITLSVLNIRAFVCVRAQACAEAGPVAVCAAASRITT